MRIQMAFVGTLALVAGLVAQTGSGRILLNVSDQDLGPNPVLIGYGDMRFTNPGETKASNPKVRRWLADKIAAEKPAAVILSGDVPWHGQEKGDYARFSLETKPWRDAGIFVSAALGNHELNGLDKQQCLENWWTAFPKLRGHRWYSAQLGSKVLVLNLDSTSDLKAGSEQQKWILDQLANLPKTVKFVFVNLHHPPVTDNDPSLGDDHNARPNEIALADLLKVSPARKQAAFVVAAGHIHNYERFLVDGTVYLVSGGGGADPKVTKRDARDLYKNPSDVNYHYVKFTMKGNMLSAEMVRVVNPDAAAPAWEVRDRFEVVAP